MQFALFRCCPTGDFLKQYELATDAMLKKLGVGLVDVPEFNCCGYPLKNSDFKSYVLSSARNLAIAEKKNLNIMTLCNCCYGSLKHAEVALQEDAALRDEILQLLAKEGLTYKNGVQVRHVLDILHKDLGVDQIKQKLVKKFNAPHMAVHYGCHILRPREIVQFDNPEDPSIIDELVELTGAKSIDWSAKLKCCGAPAWGINDELSMDLTGQKIQNAKASGAEFLCTVCVYCHLQFDRVQSLMIEKRGQKDQLPAILYPQLLGLALGIDAKALGIDQNDLNLAGLLGFLETPAEADSAES